MFTAIWEVLQEYMGTGFLWLGYLFALIYLWTHEKNKTNRILFLYSPLVVLLLFLNPLVMAVFQRFQEQEIFYRLLWLLPATVTIAYAAICVILAEKGRRRCGFIGLFAACIVLGGQLVYLSPHYSLAKNPEKVPQEIVEICDSIVIPGREVMACFPPELSMYVRQYTPYVCMPFGRQVYLGAYHPMERIYRLETVLWKDLAELSKAYHCHYLVLPRELVIEGSMEEFSMEYFGGFGEYIVYRDKTMNFATQ